MKTLRVRTFSKIGKSKVEFATLDPNLMAAAIYEEGVRTLTKPEATKFAEDIADEGARKRFLAEIELA